MHRRLLILNGLATISIVIHHAAAYGLQAMFEWTDRYMPVSVPNYDLLGSPAFHVTMIVRMLAYFSVPAFFFVSGYFMGIMAKKNEGLKWNTGLPRIKVLAIPFVVWTIARYMLLRRPPASVDEILHPYFFIPVLVQFYLLAWLIAAVARKRWKLLLFVTGALQIGFILRSTLQMLGVGVAEELVIGLPRWVFLVWPFWFPFGMVTGMHLEKITKPLVRIRWFLLAALIATSVLSIVEYYAIARTIGEEWLGPTFGGVFRTLYGMAFISCFLAFEKISIPFAKTFSQVGSKSLGIYMGNIPAIYVVAVLMYRLVPWLLGIQWIYQTILFIAGIGGPLLLMEIVRRSRARPLYRYVFG